MSIATLDPPVVFDIPVLEPVSEQKARPAVVRCYLCGAASVLTCELCGEAVCKTCYREDYGPCLIERDWCIPCADKKAQARNAVYAAYQAQYGHEPAPRLTMRSRAFPPRFA